MRLLFAVLVIGWVLSSAAAQQLKVDSWHSTKPFAIPFGKLDTQIVQVHLYVSQNEGQNWTYHSTVRVAPNQPGHFEYQAPRDGSYWFAVQAEDANRNVFPAVMNAQVPPSLKVVVDTGSTSSGTTGGGTSLPQPSDKVRPRQFTNRTSVHLKYTLEGVGKSGISEIEIWNTTDGRSWQRLKSDTPISPKEFDKPLMIPLKFEHEGIYGFTLIPRSGVGRGAAPPQNGDDAQIWIEYDKTPPVVRLISAEVGRGTDDGKLLFSWAATDKNMDDKPITLSYAADLNGPWTVIVKDLPNDGFYTWKMEPPPPLFEFYVRVEARDKAGNIGKADSVERIKVDLSQPKANVNGIEPAPGNP